jgi:hypothetical protein
MMIGKKNINEGMGESIFVERGSSQWSFPPTKQLSQSSEILDTVTYSL